MDKQKTKRHPSDTQLKRHLSMPNPQMQQHIAKCLECQLAVELMRTTPRNTPDYDFEESLVQRLTSLPAMADGAPGHPQLAKTTADTWQTTPYAAVRHAGHGVERRMRFQIAGVRIDLVVDRLGDQLECSLRVSRRGHPLPGFVVAANGRKLLPADKGFFSWSATTPPTQILLWSSQRSFTTGDIQW